MQNEQVSSLCHAHDASLEKAGGKEPLFTCQVTRQNGETFQPNILKQSMGDKEMHILQDVCRMRPAIHKPHIITMMDEPS